MATPVSNPYIYFLYSAEHISKKNEIESALGRKFECGTVIVKGKKKKYSYVTTSVDAFMKQYPDAKIIADGNRNNMTFTECVTTAKRGN